MQRTDSETVNSIRRSELSANVQTVACSLGVNLVPLYSLDPIVDKRWEALVASHPRASVFHQAGWLKALAVTYDYKPLVLTSTPEGRPLQDGIVFAEIRAGLPDVDWSLCPSRIIATPCLATAATFVT